MASADPFEHVPASLGQALAQRGFDSLTAVQEAVIDPELSGRDLRISSKTGSGKTVALGLIIASHLETPIHERKSSTHRTTASPTALVVTPTRELAAQVGAELSWLFRPLKARVAVVTGGTSINGDFRFLSRSPRVIVGTPGRLLDHLRRGTIDASHVEVVVLDEADEMLDMGFRDELDGILQTTPDDRRTHLVSATLPRGVVRLADRYQHDPISVQGTPLGEANAEITHVGHLVYDRDRVAALANMMLANPNEQMLVFVRTRVQTTTIAAELASRGFAVTPLSGEMGQRERNAALSAFRAKQVRAVVATDVAARGLDVQDVARVIHFDPPEGPESYTHRSGRTGRAGKRGVSVVLVTPRERGRVEWLTRKARVTINWEPLPTAAEIYAAADLRLIADLDAALDGDRNATSIHEDRKNERLQELAQSLLAGREPTQVLAHILAQSSHVGPCAPAHISAPQWQNKPGRADRSDKKGRHRDGRRNNGWDRDASRNSSRNSSRNDSRNSSRNNGSAFGPSGGGRDGRRNPNRAPGQFTPFFVSWGASAGANPSRLLAMVCRRGGIKGKNVGAIRIDAHRSVVEVESHLAEDFARSAARRDARNPKIKISPWRKPGSGE